MDFNGVAFGIAGLTAVLALVPVFLYAVAGGVIRLVFLRTGRGGIGLSHRPAFGGVSERGSLPVSREGLLQREKTGAIPVSGGASFSIWAVSAHQLLPVGKPVRQFAGGVELIPGSTLFRRTLAQTQCADELLAGIFADLAETFEAYADYFYAYEAVRKMRRNPSRKIIREITKKGNAAGASGRRRSPFM